MNYQTLKEADYSYVEYLGDREHLLMDNSTGNLEVFASNRGHAGWAIKYKNTHLEFCRSYPRKPLTTSHVMNLTLTNSDR